MSLVLCGTCGVMGEMPRPPSQESTTCLSPRLESYHSFEFASVQFSMTSEALWFNEAWSLDRGKRLPQGLRM